MTKQFTGTSKCDIGRDMSMDDIDKTTKRPLRLVHSADPVTVKCEPTKDVRWNPFELCEESLELLDRVVEYSKRIATALESEGESDLDKDIQQFVSAHMKASKAVLFQLLKLSYEIRTEQEDSQALIVEYAVCLQILEEALQELKLDMEAGYESAASALAEMQTLISDQIKRPGCDLDLVFDLINTLNDVKIPINDSIKEAMLKLGSSEQIEDYQVDYPSLEKMIQSLLAEGKNIHEIYDIIASPSRAMPAEGRMDFINSIGEIPGELGRSLLMLTCLDNDAEIRALAIKRLQGLKIKDFDGASLRILHCLSYWAITEDERKDLGRIVRKLTMSGLEVAPDINLGEKTRIVATAFDGSGCQVIFGALPNGDASQTFGIMLKQSEGIEDAWLSQHLSQKDLKSAVEHAELMPEQYEVDSAYLEAVMPYFIADSLERGVLIPHGLLALVPILPLHIFKPSASLFDRAIERMRELYHRDFQSEADVETGFLRLYERNYFQMWFEEGSEVEKIVASASNLSSRDVSDLVLNKIVRPNENKWRQKFVLMSILLFLCKQNSGRRWHEFFHVVQKFEESDQETILKILTAISDCSHHQMLERLAK